MAAIPYMPLYIADYMADAAHLSTLEHGAYMLLIMTYWQRGKPLPSSNERLANVARMSNEQWMSVRETIAEFFHDDGSTWTHKRIEAELAHFSDKTEKARAAGRASAQQRLNKRSTPVQQTFNHTDTDTDTEESSNTNVLLVASDADDAKPDTCPHQEIISLYHRILPACPRIRDWTAARAKHLRARWYEHAERQSLEYWEKLFRYIANCPFLVGHGSGNRPFFASLEWICKAENFAKIREGRYEPA